MDNRYEHLSLDEVAALVGESGVAAAPSDAATPVEEGVVQDAGELLEICDHLASHDLGDYGRQTRLLHAAAHRALTSPLTLEQELTALSHLHAEVRADQVTAGQPNRALGEARRATTSRWLSALQRLDAAIDPTFQPADLPQINVEAPDGLPAGVSPDAVTDPEQRARYQADIERNRRRADTYVQQWEARQLRQRCQPRAAAFIKHAFADTASDRAELTQLLDEHGVGGQRRALMLAAAAEPADGVKITEDTGRQLGGGGRPPAL